MDDLKGYDEVFNLLLEHSFRYFGPAAEMTTKITDNSSWSPSIDPNENSLVRLVDPELRESNEAYLNYYYIMDYYLFDSFLNKIKFEVENPKNKSITRDRLHELKFDEEELRKVMGNIGHLLLKERSLIGDQSSYDFLNLYFQIKKLWSIIITVRYLKESVDIGQIKVKIQKSFLIRALQEIDKANVMIENYLISFEDIYKSRETVEKHIDEFFREYLLRYFQYIIIGLTHFQKDFLHSISTKFTSIDLIKESLNALHPSNAFHLTLIEFLRTNNLQTEKEMEQFIGLIERQRIELIGVEPDSTDLDERTEFDGNNLANEPAQQPNPFEGQLQNDPNLNELSLNSSQSAGPNQPASNNIDGLNLMNDQGQLNDLLNDIGDNLTFTTLSLNTPREDDQNNENQLNESMNEDNCIETNQLDVNQLENPIDDPYQQIDNLLNSEANQENRENAEQPAESAVASEASIDQQPVLSAEVPDLTNVVIKESPKTQKTQRKTPQKTQPISATAAETDRTPSGTGPATTEPAAAANSPDQTIFSLPASLEPVNTSSESILNRSNSGSNLRKLTELTRLPVEKSNQSEDENQIDLTAIQHSINNFQNNNSDSEDFEMASATPNYHDLTASAQAHSKASQANESDDLDDLGLAIKVREVERPTATSYMPSFDFSAGPNAGRTLSKFDLLFPSVSTPNKRPAEEDKRPAKEDKRPAKEDKRPAKEDSTESEGNANETLRPVHNQESSKKNKTKSRSSRKRAQLDEDSDSDDARLASSRRKKKTAPKVSLARGERSSKKSTKKRLQTSESDSDENDSSKRPKLANNGTVRFATVDEETKKRIMSNQPKIILKQVGEVRHEGKLVPVFD